MKMSDSAFTPSDTHYPSKALNVEVLRKCVEDASVAILELWDPDRKTAWRSTLQRTREKDQANAAFFPTVTLRCVEALLSFVVRYPEWSSRRVREDLVTTWLPRVLEQDEKHFNSSLNNGTEGGILNPFTLSTYVRTLARISQYHFLTGPLAPVAQLKLQEALTDLVKHSAFTSDALSRPLGVHPFILYHATTALRASFALITTPDLQVKARALVALIRENTRYCIERLLAKSHLGALNPGESVALGFCSAVLAQDAQSEDRQYILSALRVCFDAQDASGCWPQGRVVREDKDISSDRLEISTYEIASVLGDCVVSLVRQTGEPLLTGTAFDAVVRLTKAGLYTERSIIRIPTGGTPSAGWCSDHAYGVQMIESWTSATVLESLLNLNDVSVEFDRQQILERLTSVSSSDRDWPAWLRWNEFKANSEVDSDYPVLEYLDLAVVRPILADPRALPSPNARTVSALLFGPPGTSKTTIAKAIADGLNWPLVLLSPGIFIERGLEFIEAQARSVFDDLMKLSRAVVVFDECDELFRSREPSPEVEQTRSITAFVTASMLPKLQDLHDRGRVMFFICTNNFQSMDPAVKRGGRIDHIVAVGPPDEKARHKIVTLIGAELRRVAGLTLPTFFDAGLDEIAKQSDRFNRTELSRAARALSRTPGFDDEEHARAAARKIVERLDGSLTIGVKEYAEFIQQKKQYSHPVTEGTSNP